MTRHVDTKSLFSFIWHFIVLQKFAFVTLFIVSLAWALDVTLWPYILKVFIDTLTKYQDTRAIAWQFLQYPVVLGIALWIIIEVGFRTQGFILAKVLPKTEAGIRLAMFDHIQRHSPKYFNDHFSGSLANKINDMTSQVSIILEQITTVFIPSLAGALLASILFAEINPLFTLALVIWIFVHFFICFIFSKRCDDYELIHGEVRSSLLGKIVDSFSNNFAVNVFYRFAYEKKMMERFQKIEMEKNIQAKKYSAYMRVFLGLLGFLIGGVGINGLMLYFWLNNKISTGEIAQVFNMTFNVMMMIWYTSISIPTLYQSIGLSRQAFILMQHPQDILDTSKAKALNLSSGAIEFRDVNFYYDEFPLFKNLSVKIQGGEKVGLVGYSGAGKTSFVNLILRFYPVSSGQILIDGQDISKVTLESLRKQVALIPQEPALFHRSIKDNILYGDVDAKESELIQAAQLAHCHEFIQDCSEGYDTLLGERGTKLSGGERQRIAIARAILAKAKILILDEATSALDSITENYIQESLAILMENTTTLVIAHRLSTLASMDRILVFKEGEIIEQGSHEELLELGGYYKYMWETQAFGFQEES
jgi:ATP-binding cassette subfamily B protein